MNNAISSLKSLWPLCSSQDFGLGAIRPEIQENADLLSGLPAGTCLSLMSVLITAVGTKSEKLPILLLCQLYPTVHKLLNCSSH